MARHDSSMLRGAAVAAVLVAGLWLPTPAAAYSVLAHEANVDAVWTYGIQMKDIFLNEHLAIGTYRHAVATTIPGMTKVAWSKKQNEIRKVLSTR
jgi:hypothetical protein